MGWAFTSKFLRLGQRTTVEPFFCHPPDLDSVPCRCRQKAPEHCQDSSAPIGGEPITMEEERKVRLKEGQEKKKGGRLGRVRENKKG